MNDRFTKIQEYLQSNNISIDDRLFDKDKESYFNQFVLPPKGKIEKWEEFYKKCDFLVKNDVSKCVKLYKEGSEEEIYIHLKRGDIDYEHVNMSVFVEGFKDPEELKVYVTNKGILNYEVLDKSSIKNFQGAKYNDEKTFIIKTLEKLFSVKAKHPKKIPVSFFIVNKDDTEIIKYSGDLFSRRGESEVRFEYESSELDQSQDNTQKEQKEFIYKSGLANLLLEADNDSYNVLKLTTNPDGYTKEELEEKLKEAEYEFFGGINSDEDSILPTDNELLSSRYVSNIGYIVRKFEGKGFKLSKEDVISYMFVYEILRDKGVDEVIKVYKDKKPKSFEDYHYIMTKVKDDKFVARFINEAFDWLLDNKFKNIDALEDGFARDGISPKEFMKFLYSFLKLEELQVKKVFNESNGKNSANLLTEALLLEKASEDEFFKTSTSRFNRMFKFFGNLKNLFGNAKKKYFKDAFLSKIQKERILNSFASSPEVQETVIEIIVNMMTFYVYEFHRINFGIQYKFSEKGKTSAELKLTGNFLKDIDVLITGEIQKGLFTEDFRKTQQLANPGKKISDDDLLKAWEASLNDIVMSYMREAMSAQSQEVEDERDELAYRNRMDEMDASVLTGMAALPASMALAVGVGGMTFGLPLVGLGVASAFFGGKIGGGLKKKFAKKMGPKEKAFVSDAEKDKMIIRNVIIQLAKEELNIKESAAVDEDFIYLAGLSLLVESLKEEDEKEEKPSEETSTEKEEKSMRGSISWDKLSRKLTSSNFFLFNPKVTKKLGPQKAAEEQFEFGSHLAALTEECFGLVIRDVDKVDFREAQSMSVTKMLVNRDAAMGEGSINGGQTNGMQGAGPNDEIGMQEFLHMVNNFPGGITQAVVYLMINGKLDGLLKTIKGGNQTPMDVIEGIAGALSGNADSFPKSFTDIEESIQNLEDDTWIKKFLRLINKDAPVLVVYDDEKIKEEDILKLVEGNKDTSIVRQLVEFSNGFKENADLKSNSINNHKAIIEKTKASEVDQTDKSFYQFICSEENARRLVLNGVRFIKKSEDSSTKNEDDLKYKLIVQGEQDVFNNFNKSYKQSDDADSLVKKIAAILIIKVMRKSAGSDSKFRKYHKTFTATGLGSYSSSGRDYALKVANIILGKSESADISDNTNNKAVDTITKTLQEYYDGHMDLYKMWKSR